MAKRKPRLDLPAWRIALQDARDGLGPAPFCEGESDLYVDFAQPPTAAEARYLCAPCPLLALCKKNAEHISPKWGVVGGRVWGRKLAGDVETEVGTQSSCK